MMVLLIFGAGGILGALAMRYHLKRAHEFALAVARVEATSAQESAAASAARTGQLEQTVDKYKALYKLATGRMAPTLPGSNILN